MGAEVPIKVRYMKLIEDNVVVSAVSLDEAKEEALKLPGVAQVICAQYADECDCQMGETCDICNPEP